MGRVVNCGMGCVVNFGMGCVINFAWVVLYFCWHESCCNVELGCIVNFGMGCVVNVGMGCVVNVGLGCVVHFGLGQDDEQTRSNYVQMEIEHANHKLKLLPAVTFPDCR